MSGPPYARQRLAAIINFSGGQVVSVHAPPPPRTRRRPPCGSSLGSYFLYSSEKKPPHDNPRGGFPPLADVLASPPRKSGTSTHRH